MAHTVFICHSSKDKLVANAACAALEARRVKCWIAPRDIVPGSEYGEAIIDGLTDCMIVLLVFSEHSNESPQVRREIERAVSKGKIIISFRIADVLPKGSMEYALSNRHWLDALTPPLESRLMELCHSVEALLQKRSEPLWVEEESPAATAGSAAGAVGRTDAAETEVRSCPRCGKEYPAKNRHCAVDGSALREPHAPGKAWGPVAPAGRAAIPECAQLLIRAKPKIDTGPLNAFDANSVGVEINAARYEMGWGEKLFTVAAGACQVKVGVKSPIYSQMRCAVSTTLTLEPGTTTALRYTGGLTFFQDGKLVAEGTSKTMTAPPGRKLCTSCRADMPASGQFCSRCGATQA